MKLTHAYSLANRVAVFKYYMILSLILTVIMFSINLRPNSATDSYHKSVTDIAPDSNTYKHTAVAYKDSAVSPTDSHQLTIDSLKILLPAKKERNVYRKFFGNELPPLDPGMVNVTAQSDGIKLSNVDSGTIILAIPIAVEKIPNGYTVRDVHIYWFNNASLHWQQLKRDSIDIENNIVYSTAGKDGDYISGIVQVPEAPETQGFVPTYMSDLKVGDPGAMVQTIEPPQPNKDGSASLVYRIETPKGRQGIEPNISIVYNSDGGNSILGEGWSLGGISSITVDTRWGVPRYSKTEETETYMLDGEMLAMGGQGDTPTTSHRKLGITREPDKKFFKRRESDFNRIERMGKSPDKYYWRITDKRGTKFYYGGTDTTKLDAVLKDSKSGNIVEWKLRKIEDLFENSIEYRYNIEPINADGNIIAQIIPQKILYTIYRGQSHIDENLLYQIDFRYRTNSLPREDKQVSGRHGFLTTTNFDLLSDIAISLIKYKNTQEEYSWTDSIRKYTFNYTEGEYKKTILNTICQFGFNKTGEHRWSDTLFNEHKFEYYNFAKINNQLFNNPVEIDIPSKAVLGSSKTDPRIGLGGAAGVGVFDGNSGSKSLSADAQFSYKESGTTGQSAFVDITGDGLPDYVQKKDDVLTYRASKITDGKITFGREYALQNVKSFSSDNGSSIGGGWQVNGPTGSRIFAGRDYSTSHNYTKVYFADANGDGLLDIVDNGVVKFNTANGTEGPIAFEITSDNTPGILKAGNRIAGELQLDQRTMKTQRDYNIKISPLHDIVKTWIAPDSGTVSIYAPIKLLRPVIDSDDIEDSAKYKKADGVVFSIQKNDSLIKNQTLIHKGDTAWKSKDSIRVKNIQKGDIIIFRLQSGNADTANGDYDSVIWNPTIQYLNKSKDKIITDLFSDNPFYYNAREDMLPSTGMLMLPDSGKLWMNSTLKKAFTRDSVHIKIWITGHKIVDSTREEVVAKRNSGFRADTSKFIPDTTYIVYRYIYKQTDSVLFEKTLDTSSQSLAIDINQLSYSSNTKLFIEVSGSSNIDFRSINWIPVVQHKHPISPGASVCYPKYSFKGNLINSGTVYSTKDSGQVEIYPRIKLNEGIHPRVKLVISDTTSVITKIFITDSASAASKIIVPMDKNHPFFVHYEIDSVQQYIKLNGLLPGFDAVSPDFAEWIVPKTGNYSFYATSPGDLRKAKYKLNENPLSRAIKSDTLSNIQLQKGDKIYFLDTTNGQTRLPFRVSIPEGAAIFADWDKADWGNMYRGWGQGVFNGMNNLSTPVKPVHLKADSINSKKSNLFEVPFFSMALKQDTLKLVGPNSMVFIMGDTMGVSRLAIADVQPIDVFRLDAPKAGGAIAPARYSKTTTETSAEGGFGLSTNDGKGDSKNISDYIDLNGDRYPDFAAEKYVQYTNVLGGLSKGEYHGQIVLPVSTVHSKGYNYGGNFDHPTKSNAGSKIQNTGNISGGSAATTSTLGGFSGGISTNNDDNERTLQDVNGDGLPDIVTRTSVFLNLGYKFIEYKGTWGFSDLQSSKSEITSLGGGINIDNYSIAAGINHATTTSCTSTTLIDFNGDGLTDILSKSGGGLSVKFSTGLSINQAPNQANIIGPTNVSKTNAESWGINASYTYAPGSPLPPIKFVFNVAANTSKGTSNNEAQFVDIDGDGYPDYIEKTDDKKASIYISNLAKINRLETVQRPLGGSFKIDYKHTPASFKHPGGKWVMAKVVKDDGVKDDGENPVSVFDYEEGFYDRYEREFLGFGKVIQYDSLNGKIGRKNIQLFDTKTYYTANNILEERVEDESGNKHNTTKYTYYKRARQSTLSRAVADLPADPRFYEGIIQTPLKDIKKFVSEGNTASPLLLSQEEFNYDTLLNVITYRYREGTSLALDYTRFTTSIQYNKIEKDENVYGLPVSVEIKDGKGKMLRKQKAWYPKEAKINGSSDKMYYYKLATDTIFFTKNDYAVTRYEYDTYGNLNRKIFADGHQISYTYDNSPDGHMMAYIRQIDEEFPDGEFQKKWRLTNSFGIDYRFGIYTSRKLTNDGEVKTFIDAFGRPVRITGPRESSDDPQAKIYTILIEYQHRQKNPYSIVKHYDVFHKEAGIYTINFIDGFRKSLQIKKTGFINDSAAWVVSGRQKFDQLYRITDAYYPTSQEYDVSGNSVGTIGRSFSSEKDIIHPTITTYDYLDRVLTLRLPDKKLYSSNTYAVAKDILGHDALVTTTDYTDKHTNQKRVFTNGSGLTSSEVFFLNVSGDSTKTTCYKYNPVHQLDTVFNLVAKKLYHVSANKYDWSGRRTDYYNISSGLTKYEYDKIGNIIKRTSAGGWVTEYAYEHNRLRAIDYPAHPEDSVRYWYGNLDDKNNVNNRGQVVFQIDATGAQSFSYDEFGNIITNTRTIIAPFDSMYTFTTRYHYDSWNRIESMQYPGGEVVRYKYNRAGLLDSVYGSDPGSTTIKYPYVEKVTYDKFEKRTGIAYGNKTKTTYTYYDDRRTLKRVVTSDPSGLIVSHAYEYDDLNNVKLASNRSRGINERRDIEMTHQYDYDNQNQLKIASGTWKGSSAMKYELRLGYDDQMNIASRYLNLSSNKVTRTINGSYSYPATNPLQLFSQNELITRKEGSAVPYEEVNNDQHYYDKDGRDIWTSTADGFQNTVTERKVFWDEENRIRAISKSGYVSCYTYDARGDRTIKLSAEVEGVYVNGKSAAKLTHPATYSLYASPYYSMRNSNGIGTKHIYIGTERIVSQLTNDSAWSKNNKDVITHPPLTEKLQVQLTKDLYANADEVKVPYSKKLTKAELVINGYFDSLQVPYQPMVHGAFKIWPALKYPVLNDPEKPGEVGAVNHSGVADEKLQYFYHSNYLGSTSLVTDKTKDRSGNIKPQVVQYAEYLPFGETFMEQRKDYSSQFMFNGKEQDRETGLYYYGARYYDPQSYQWLGVDPMAEKYIGMNPYNFSANNPIRMRDVDGRESSDELACNYVITKSEIQAELRKEAFYRIQQEDKPIEPSYLIENIIGGIGLAKGAITLGKAVATRLVAKESVEVIETISSTTLELGAVKTGLQLESSVAKVMGNSYKAMGEVTVPIKNTELLNSLNTTSKGNWVKVYEAGMQNGAKIETHYFRNSTTGQVFDVKTKYNYWHQKAFKNLGQ